MPATRYGPDVTDDAAYMINAIIDYQDAQDAMRRGARISGREMQNLRARANRMRELAKQLANLSDDDIDNRRFGVLDKLSRYSHDGRLLLSRRYNRATGRFEYNRSKRKQPARNWRTKGLMRRDVEEEFARRGQGGGRSSLRPDIAPNARNRYSGWTNPKELQEATAEFLAGVAGRQIQIGNKRIQIRSQIDMDNLGIAKRARPGQRGGAPVSRRPPKAKSVQRAQQRARAAGRRGPRTR